MKFSHEFSELQAAESPPPQAVTNSDNQEAAALGEDEITDEALLEAIVGTGNSGCAGGDTRGPAVPLSIGRRHFHKHH